MAGLKRFSVSLEQELLDKLNRFCKEKGLSNRSQAVRALIRDYMVEREWILGKEIAGTITIVYDNTRRELMDKLMSLQHEFYDIIISTQHIHLDHINCLEIVVVKGKPDEAQKLCDGLQSMKGVKRCALTMATTGKGVP